MTQRRGKDELETIQVVVERGVDDQDAAPEGTVANELANAATVLG